ncbi:TonB-dependent receptor domain-containing protein [Sphingomonas sp. DT-204]|uniref:TonB-dependent receptor domain-containing protein n=1 Tax=Sphingomonas sp. DT-204 TaxID=3396166 RepID=UPI003F1ABE63
MSIEYVALACGVSLCAVSPACAQRVDDNAVADAEDAFGSNDGGEDLGVYGPGDVRGFSPIDAGNVRIEGLFIDRQADLSPRLVEGNRIRVGPSAIGYAFPAPSGIVDYRLRKPGAEAVLSLVSQANSFGGMLIEVDAMMPIAGRTLGIGAAASFSRSEYASGNNADVFSMMATAAWRPNDLTEIQPFWSRVRITDEDIFPIIIGNGQGVPPRMTRRQFVGQRWADVETERFNYGAISRTRLGGFGIRAGAFRSVNVVREGHSVLLDAAEPGVLAGRTVIARPRRSNVSTSGEIGISRQFGQGGVRHEFQLIARARSQNRIYGGADSISLRPAPFDEPDYVARPDFVFSAKSDDRVRQWTAGLAYQGRVAGVGQINLGVQRSDYTKTVRTPAGALPASRDKPWLFNAGATLDVTRSLALYGSITRGLEESEVAPEIALNRDEAPSAIRTKQIDAGLRLRVGPMAVIAGGFEIEKPYYGLDTGNIFRTLGTIRHRGLEGSLAGSPVNGWTLVAGGVLLDARLAGDEVASGAIGRRPVGTPSHTLSGNIEWRPPQWDAFSADLAAEHRGPTYSDVANALRVGSYTTIDLGVRYRFALQGAPAVLRLQATNLFNTYGWEVFGNNAFTYIQSRQLIARLTVDL